MTKDWSKAEFEACTGFEQKVITNGDRIRQMSNEGIAAFVCGVLNDRKEETFLAVLDFSQRSGRKRGRG